MAVVGKKVFQFYPCSSAHPEPSAMAGFMLPVHTFVDGRCCVVPIKFCTEQIPFFSLK